MAERKTSELKSILKSSRVEDWEEFSNNYSNTLNWREYFLSLLDENQKNSIEEKYLEKDTVNCVQKAVQSLSKKEADVISRHYGFGNKKAESFSEIAEFYGLTKVRIHQIEQKAFYTLRNSLEDLYA